ncbi:universal stress protein [candidate division KSB1 bacterium]|nr:universal stress protein [candidate division KSB1 bacterium]
MIKRILIPLDPSPYTETALEIGCIIARQHNAEITGLVILDIPGIKKTVGPVPLGAIEYADKLEHLKEKEAHDHIHILLSKFREKCSKEGVLFREAELQGSPSERIIRESIYYDLVVMGLRTFFHYPPSDKPGDTLDEVMDQSITPILGVPQSFTFPDISKEKIKVLVAFDGSLPSASALQSFVTFAIPDVMEVALLTSDDNNDAAEYHLTQAEAYLKSHSIFNIKKEKTTENIKKIVNEKYLNWATLIVVGTHSKSGIFDFMVGSLTKELIKTDKKPLLISQ